MAASRFLDPPLAKDLPDAIEEEYGPLAPRALTLYVGEPDPVMGRPRNNGDRHVLPMLDGSAGDVARGSGESGL